MSFGLTDDAQSRHIISILGRSRRVYQVMHSFIDRFDAYVNGFSEDLWAFSFFPSERWWTFSVYVLKGSAESLIHILARILYSKRFEQPHVN